MTTGPTSSATSWPRRPCWRSAGATCPAPSTPTPRMDAPMAEREPERMSNRELVGEVRKLRHLLARHLGAGRELWMESGVNTEGRAFIHLHWGDESGQLTPATAREHALAMLETVAAAEFDAALWAVAVGPMGMEPEQAAGLLGMMREARGG